MYRVVLPALALATFFAPIHAQDLEAYQRHFQQGIDDLTSGRLEAGIAAFKRCLEIVPDDPTCAYNIACGHSLKKEPDLAFEWLDKSAAWGFGNGEGNIDHARSDPDLESLRADARFQAYIEAMERQRKVLEEYWSKPAVYVPDALKDAQEVPLLIVLHDAGETKDSVVSGVWKDIADELGTALLAPSGKFPTAGLPSNGMSWFDDPNAYVQRYWTYERTANDAVSAFKKERKLDPKRVFLAGEGQGGTLAFNMAVAGPGLYKGVVTLDALVVEQLASSRAPNAGRMGLKVRLLFGKGGVEGAPEGFDLDAFLGGLRKRLVGWGLDNQVDVYEPVAGDPAQVRKIVVAALRSLTDEVAKPIEAGSGK